MTKAVTATEMYRAYKDAQKTFDKTHSNSDCIDMLSAYGVYKAVGGTRAFSLASHKFSTEKARLTAEKKYRVYIDYVYDFTTFYAKIAHKEFNYKWKLKELIGKKYRRLIDPKMNSNDAQLIMKAMLESELTPNSERNIVEALLVTAKSLYDKASNK